MHSPAIRQAMDNFSWASVTDAWGPFSDLIRACKLRQHPLGFAHGELLRRDDTSLRLHIWDSSQRFVQEPRWLVHTHAFDLKSVVLVGQLTNHLFQWTDMISNPDSRIYRIGYEADVSRLEATDIFGRCEPVSSEDYTMGADYGVDFGDFHTSFVPEGTFTATIARTIRRPGTPLVVGEIAGRPSYSYGRNELSQHAHDHVIGELFRRLDLLSKSQ